MSQHTVDNREVNGAKTHKFGVHDFIRLILPHWYWYLVSLIIFIGGAWLYLRMTPPEYMRTATVLVKDSRKGSGTEVTAFSDIMGGIGRRSVDNEIHIFESRRLMESVVNDCCSRSTKPTQSKRYAHNGYGLFRLLCVWTNHLKCRRRLNSA